MAVIVLIGLLAGAVGWSVLEQARSASFERAMMMLEQEDARARMAASRFGSEAILRIDRETGEVFRGVVEGDGAVAWAPRVRLPEGTWLGGVIGDGDDRPFEGVEVVELRYASGGRGRSVALEVVDEAGDSGWLVFVGLTGQAIRMQEERDVVQTFDR